MSEVEIRFSRENLEGVVAVGTYLCDAAKRFGIHFEEGCDTENATHSCSVIVENGSELLSEMTTAEKEHFDREGRKPNERLACQVKIEKPGEVVIMTKEKVKDPAPETQTTEDGSEQYRKAFAEMPLEKKIANLVQLETIALGETVSFIINSPFKVADKIMDVMAEFGFKKEEKQKEAARPAEHQSSTQKGASKTKEKKGSKGKDQATAG